MTAPPEVVKHSELLNQLVIDLNTMEELGRINALWMHPLAHRVLGFICNSGLLGTKKLVFNLAQIKTLGANSILVNAKPVETDNRKVRQLETLLNCEVWSDAGNKTGDITDYLFNLKTGAITQYLLVSNRWGGLASGVYLLPSSQILSIGSKRVLVSAAAVQTLSVEREGIKQKLAKAGNLLKQDYMQATQDLQTLAQQAQSTTKGAKERTQALAEQAKEKVQTINDQFKQGTQTLSKQAKQKGQNLVEQVKEQAQIIGEQVKENTQSLTGKTKERLDLVNEKSLNVKPNPSSVSSSNRTESADPAILDDDEPWI